MSQPFTRGVPFALGMLVVAVACSSSETAPATPQGPPLDALFTDPAMPHCDGNFATQYQLKGQLAGQTIQVAGSAFSNLDGAGFQIVEVVGGTVRNNLALTWNPPLAEDTALALTGASIIIPEGQPSGGQSFCITSGKFGSRSLMPGAAGRELLFQITGARSGDCNGTDTPIKLNGCIFRTNTYFPVPIPADAGLHFESDAALPAVDPSTELVDLTNPQMVALCDWYAASMGGYGTVTDCMGEGFGGTVKNYDNAAQCIFAHFGTACPTFKVSDFEACITAMIPKRGCTVMPACDRIPHCQRRDL